MLATFFLDTKVTQNVSYNNKQKTLLVIPNLIAVFKLVNNKLKRTSTTTDEISPLPRKLPLTNI